MTISFYWNFRAGRGFAIKRRNRKSDPLRQIVPKLTQKYRQTYLCQIRYFSSNFNDMSFCFVFTQKIITNNRKSNEFYFESWRRRNCNPRSFFSQKKFTATTCPTLKIEGKVNLSLFRPHFSAFLSLQIAARSFCRELINRKV